MKTTILVAASLCAMALGAQTVERDMNADRPGFRNSTHLVGRGVVQMENGLAWSRDHNLRWQPEVRIGALHWLEFRLVSEAVIVRPQPGGEIRGTADLQPSVKFPLLDLAWGTRVVCILKSTVPSGHGSQSTGGYEPGFELPWEHELSNDTTISGTLNLTRLKQELFVWQKAASLSVNRDLRGRARVFLEGFVQSPYAAGQGNQWVIDAGWTRQAGSYIGVDASAGVSVHGPKTWFLAAGISLRSKVPEPAFASVSKEPRRRQKGRYLAVN